MGWYHLTLGVCWVVGVRGTWVHLQGTSIYPAGIWMLKFRSMIQNLLADVLLGLFCFCMCVRAYVCACVRVGLIETALKNWYIMHRVYFQLLWKSQEIWPHSPGKQQSGETAACLDMVMRLSSPPSLPPSLSSSRQVDHLGRHLLLCVGCYLSYCRDTVLCIHISIKCGQMKDRSRGMHFSRKMMENILSCDTEEYS